jgi:energy-coupling factor transport system substrate-specific component
MISFVAVTAVAYVVLSLTSNVAFAAFGSSFSPRIAAGGVLALSLLFGPAAAWGSAFGYLGADVARGVLGFSSVYSATGYFLLAYLGYSLWGNLGRLSSGSGPAMRSRKQIAEYLVVALVSLSALVAVSSWGYAVLGVLPYFVAVTDSFADYLFPVVVIGPVVLYALYPRFEANDLVYRGVSRSEASMWRTYTVSFVLLSWLLLGVAISIAHQTYQQLPYLAFVRRDLEFVVTLSDTVFGPTGARIQVALGSLLFSTLLLVLIYRGGFSPADRITND